MTIRLAHASEAATLRVCATAAFTPYIAAIGKPPAPMQAAFASHIARQEAHVAITDEKIAGYIIFFARDGVMHLDNMAVWPTYAGQGIGKRLMAHCETAARAMGLRKIALYTNAKMTANLRLYPHLGFQEVDRRDEDGFARVFFVKPLT